MGGTRMRWTTRHHNGLAVAHHIPTRTRTVVVACHVQTTTAAVHVARLQQRDRILRLRGEAELVMQRLTELARRQVVGGVAVEGVEEPIDRLTRLRSNIDNERTRIMNEHG